MYHLNIQKKKGAGCKGSSPVKLEAKRKEDREVQIQSRAPQKHWFSSSQVAK